MLVILPVGGLGNRMRVVDSSLALSKATGENLRLIWLLNPSLNCKIEDLFVIPERVERVTCLNMYTLSGKIRWRLYQAYFSLFYDLYLSQEDVIAILDLEESIEELVAGKRVYITTYSRYYNSPRPFGELVPIKALQERIDEVTKGFKNVVGVHIRRMDNTSSTKYSPTSLFVEQMKTELELNHDTRFFLATDSPEVEEQLRQAFPGRIITYPKRALDRNNPLAAQDALIDLFCLSRCRKLIGSYWSSFTDVAWQIRGIERLIVKEEAPD
jgi:hypothetical protein